MNKYPLNKNCLVCGSSFSVNNGAEFRNVTCSKKCGDKKAAKARSGKNHWNYKNPKAKKGKDHPFYGKHHSNEAKEKNRISHLGKQAWNKGKKGIQVGWNKGTKGIMNKNKTSFKAGLTPWNKGKKFPQLSGENNPSWKGGKTSELKKLRNSIEFRLWRESVFARDNWTCQKCNVRGVHLHPHHILNFSNNPSVRFAIDNGITLCKECHFDFHSVYGRKDNDKHQLNEWLNKKFETDFIHEYSQLNNN